MWLCDICISLNSVFNYTLHTFPAFFGIIYQFEVPDLLLDYASRLLFKFRSV